MNLTALALFGIAAVALVVFLVVRNQKDKINWKINSITISLNQKMKKEVLKLMN